jgi:hypothetical protein
MKNLILLIFILSTFRSYASDCEFVPQIMEFYECKYVFEGNVVSKIYSKDGSTYTITLKIKRHYKESDTPKSLTFTMKSEFQYTNYEISDGIHADVNQNWLVYVKENKGDLVFGNECSRTRRIDTNPIKLYEQKVLDFGNNFKLQDYIFDQSICFNNPENITSIEAIFQNAKVKSYRKPHCWLEVLVNEKGDLLSVFKYYNYRKKTDATFGLITKIIEGNSRPLSEFEKDVIEMLNQVKKWEIKKHTKTEIPVSYIKFIEVT